MYAVKFLVIWGVIIFLGEISHGAAASPTTQDTVRHQHLMGAFQKQLLCDDAEFNQLTQKINLVLQLQNAIATRWSKIPGLHSDEIRDGGWGAIPLSEDLTATLNNIQSAYSKLERTDADAETNIEAAADNIRTFCNGLSSLRKQLTEAQRDLEKALPARQRAWLILDGLTMRNIYEGFEDQPGMGIVSDDTEGHSEAKRRAEGEGLLLAIYRANMQLTDEEFENIKPKLKRLIYAGIACKRIGGPQIIEWSSDPNALANNPYVGRKGKVNEKLAKLWTAACSKSTKNEDLELAIREAENAEQEVVDELAGARADIAGSIKSNNHNQIFLIRTGGLY